MKITFKTTLKEQQRQRWVEETLTLLGTGWKEIATGYRDGGANVRLICDVLEVEAVWRVETPQQVANSVAEATQKMADELNS